MKHLRTLSLAAICLLSFGAHATAITGLGAPSSNAALTGGTVIDFEAATAGDYSALTIGNVTFKGVDDSFRITSDYVGSYNNTGRLDLDNGPYDSTMTYSFRFDFASTVNAFAFNWGAADNVWLLSAYDSSNNLLDSLALTATHGSNAGDYFGLTAANIAYATLINQSGDAGDWVMIDNFTHSAAAQVPEPASLALLGLGLAGLAASRKRKAG